MKIIATGVGELRKEFYLEIYVCIYTYINLIYANLKLQWTVFKTYMELQIPRKYKLKKHTQEVWIFPINITRIDFHFQEIVHQELATSSQEFPGSLWKQFKYWYTLLASKCYTSPLWNQQIDDKPSDDNMGEKFTG